MKQKRKGKGGDDKPNNGRLRQKKLKDKRGGEQPLSRPDREPSGLDFPSGHGKERKGKKKQKERYKETRK